MNKYDKIGIVLLLIGVSIYFVKFGFLIGFPIYLVGTVILLFGNLKIRHKILWVLVPAISLYSYYNLASSYFSDINKIDLILPSKFKGTAIIIDNTDFGQTFEKKQNREQIIFDENGIVFYPTELELHSSLFRVFIKQKTGELKRVLLSSESSEKTTLLAFGESRFEKTIESENKYIPYDFVRIGGAFEEQGNSEKRCELIELIKKGKLKTVYNKVL